MKKSIKAVFGLVVVAILFSSCGAENDILGQFSKRKYLKKSKATKQIELAEVQEQKNDFPPQTKEVELIASTSVSQVGQLEQLVSEKEFAALEEQMQEMNTIALDFNPSKDWQAYNRTFHEKSIANFDQHVLNENTQSLAALNRASDVVLVILCIFLPPVAVILYEDTVTGNFWLDLVLTLLFWLPGMIYAFLVCFADVSI